MKHLPSGLQNIITPVMSCAALAVVAKYVGHAKESVKAVVCVIYYNMLEDETVWLLLIYAKNEHASIPAHILKAIKEEITCP
ncbi:MAG: hypothetical protein L0H12_01995 [Nitrosospira sp.]|nr:hypothetical protein [Nitrosospira sp.]